MRRKRMILFGCGYVGRAVAEAADRQGYDVWIQSRNPERLKSVGCVPPERKIVSQLESSDWHENLAGDWDVAINLVSSAGGGLDGYRQSYVMGNRSILDWSRGVTLDRFIYTSATSVYPQSDGSWVEEDDVPETDRLSPSGQILRQAEREILADATIPSVTILRLAGIYGPGRHLYLDRLRDGVGELPGNGKAWLNLIYLKDIVRILLLLAASDGPGSREVFNAVDDQPSRKQEIVDWLASELRLPGARFNPDLQHQRTRRRMSGGSLPDRRVSNALLRKKTGWQPSFPSYRDGYQDILRGELKES